MLSNIKYIKSTETKNGSMHYFLRGGKTEILSHRALFGENSTNGIKNKYLAIYERFMSDIEGNESVKTTADLEVKENDKTTRNIRRGGEENANGGN